MLTVSHLSASYGPVQVLFDINISVGSGEIVTLLGRNGMGKTTTVKAITGLNPARSGKIFFRNLDVTRMLPHNIAKHGMGLVPEGRQIFPTLSARENLVATAANRSGKKEPWTLDKIYELFPRLAERKDQYGGSLSGGEQQMLAIGRALMTNPELLVLDEATEGLAPLIRKEIYQCVALLKARGQSILIIDKHIDELVRIADRHVVIEKGRTVWTGNSDDFLADSKLRQLYLGV